MNKFTLYSLFLLLFSCSGITQEQVSSGNEWSNQTSFRTGFYHLGSYAKENPSFFLEQQLDFIFQEKYSLGLGTGFNIYPAALAFPVFVEGKRILNINQKRFHVTQSYGVNLKLGDIFFYSNRYMGNFNIVLSENQRVDLVTGLGYVYLWDSHGGKNVSFLFNIYITY